MEQVLGVPDQGGASKTPVMENLHIIAAHVTQNILELECTKDATRLSLVLSSQKRDGGHFHPIRILT